MLLDLLKSGPVDRSTTSTIYHQMIRGTLTELLIINTATWHHKDKLTIKLRHEGGTLVLVDRVSCLLLATLCDLKKGLTTTGTPDFIGTADGENDENGGFVQVNQGIKFYQNAFTLPLGHITLSGTQVLEITVECAQDANKGKGQVKITGVKRKARTDLLLTYEVISDLECQYNGIREIYLCGRNNQSFFLNDPDAAKSTYGLPKAKDITVKLNVDGDDQENEMEAYGAITAIDGQLTYPTSGLVRVFQDFESVPAYVYIKVYGEDATPDLVQILLIRETQVPHMVAASIVAAVDKEQKRVEVLEQNEPEKARALQQTGQIATSAALAVAKENFVPAVATPVK